MRPKSERKTFAVECANTQAGADSEKDLLEAHLKTPNSPLMGGKKRARVSIQIYICQLIMYMKGRIKMKSKYLPK